MASVVPGDHMPDGMGLPYSSKVFVCTGTHVLDCGGTLQDPPLAYNTYGTLDEDGSNCIIVGHSLTSNSCVHEWWPEMLGEGSDFALDTTKYFVVCVNYLASVYGSCSPLSIDPRTNARYGSHFPITSIRDNVRLQHCLLRHLGVRRVHVALGGSLGGMLAMQWAVSHPDMVDRVVAVACCAQHSAWAIGIGEVERQAIFTDAKWRNGDYPLDDPPVNGMSVARQLAMLTYRAPSSFTEKFGRAARPAARNYEESVSRSTAMCCGSPPFFEVESYLNYQGAKFMKRFDPLCYVRISQTLDTHDIGMDKWRSLEGDYREVLAAMTQVALIVGVDSDILYPMSLQEEMASLIPRATFAVIRSPHGHDSFLIEIQQVNDHIRKWLQTAIR